MPYINPKLNHIIHDTPRTGEALAQAETQAGKDLIAAQAKADTQFKKAQAKSDTDFEKAQSKTYVKGVTSEQVDKIQSSFKEKLLPPSRPQLERPPPLEATPLPLITADDASIISKEEVKALSSKIVAALDAEKSGTATPVQEELLSSIRELPSDVIRAFSPENLSELPIKVLKELSKESIQNLTQTQYTAIAEKEDQHCYGRSDKNHQEYQSVLSIYSNHQTARYAKKKDPEAEAPKEPEAKPVRGYEPPQYSKGVKDPNSPPASPNTVQDIEDL